MPSTGQTEEPVVGRSAPGQRWSVARKRQMVLRRMGAEPAEPLARDLGVWVYRPER